MKAQKMFLAGGLALGITAVSCNGSMPTFTIAGGDRRGNANYYSNQGSLQDDAFVVLPLSAVKASGWLENQLLLQKNGLTGNMYLFNEYNEATSRWLGAASGEAWERGPYYMRGLVALAFALDDPQLKTQAMKWINSVLDSQKNDGSFGPVSTGDWWPAMPVMVALRDYYEYTVYTGSPDERVIDFLTNYFRFQAENLPSHRLNNWADERGGDNIDAVFWLYNRLYSSAKPGDTEWLLTLGSTLKSQTADWTARYNTSTARYHVVNTSQGLKMPAVWYQYSKNSADRNAAANGIYNWSIDHGRIDGLPNADEGARDNRSTRGTETCGIVENLYSMQINERILGEAWIGDYIEKIAYNALPATTTPDSTGYSYYVLQNQVLATLGNHEFDNDHGDSSAFGAPDGFDCCFSNFHMGWPKFVQTMWMATRNNGLALTAYGPNSVTAKVAGGKTAVFVQKTDYPFKDTVNLYYDGEEADFELMLRIPAWAVNPVASVNGENVQPLVSGEYCTVERTWKKGDTVELVFPGDVKVSTWYNNSVGVEKGPLIYALKIDEQWKPLEGTAGNDMRELKVANIPGYPMREVFALSRWNYGLAIDYDNPAPAFTVEESPEVAVQPFSVDGAPVTLKVAGQLVPDWGLDGNLAGPQPFITPPDARLVSTIELIPYGSGRLRITQFPRIGNPLPTVLRSDPQRVSINTEAYTEFENVVVPAAGDYTLKITGSGQGRMEVNSMYSQDISLSGGTAEVTGLKTKTQDYFRFDSGQLNKIRFSSGLTVQSIEVIPVDRTGGSLTVSSASRSVSSMRFVTNLSAQETPYRVLYGTRPGIYDVQAHGFKTGNAVIAGLDPEKTYYAKVAAFINGAPVQSPEFVFAPASPDGMPRPNVNAAQAVYSGFNSLNYMQQDWKFYSPENAVSFTQDSPPGLRFNRSTNVKAVLETEGSGLWSDYVAEVTIAVDGTERNNAGLMLRVQDQRDGADGYSGYFVGIGRVAGSVNGPGIMIGFADGGWHDLKTVAWPVSAGKRYSLKVVAYGEVFAVYIDGVFAASFEDSRFGSGTVGLRCYDEAFTVYNVAVRPVTEEDLGESNLAGSITGLPADAGQTLRINAEAFAAGRNIQVKFDKTPGALTYKVAYGTAPGQYTGESVDIETSRYRPEAIPAGKTTVLAPSAGTYYLRFYGLSGSRVVAVSDEMRVEVSP